MLIVDVNLLIYAANRDAPDHSAAKRWWESVLNDDEPVGLAWLAILAFLRITTNSRVLASPLSLESAAEIVDEWLEQPATRIVHPTERHWKVLKALLEPFGTAGNLTSDAHLAALAIEHGAELFSTDRDFARFAGLRWRNPLE